MFSFIRRKRQRGLTLTEVAMVMAVLAISMTSLTSMLNDNTAKIKAGNNKERLVSISDAAAIYISEFRDELIAQTGGGTVVAIPVAKQCGTCSAPSGPGSLDSIQDAGLLPASFVDLNSAQQHHALLVQQTPSGDLEAIVTTYEGTPFEDEQIGQISQLMGASGGGVYSNGIVPDDEIAGSLGGWGADVSDWSASIGADDVTPAPGHVQVSLGMADVLAPDFASADEVLHRIDTGDPADNRMQTAINMGGENINNAGAVNASGNVTGWNLDANNDVNATNNVTAGGNADVTGNVVAGGFLEANQVFAGRFVDSNDPSNTYVVNPSAVSTLDRLEINRMVQNLNMGGNSINNVDNVNATGGITADGSITSNGSVSAANSIDAGGQVTGTRFVDTNDTSFLMNPSGMSFVRAMDVQNDVTFGGRIIDADNSGRYLDLDGVSEIQNIHIERMVLNDGIRDADDPNFVLNPEDYNRLRTLDVQEIQLRGELLDRNDSNYKVNPSGISRFNSIQVEYIEDENDPNYWVNPNMRTSLATLDVSSVRDQDDNSFNLDMDAQSRFYGLNVTNNFRVQSSMRADAYLYNSDRRLKDEIEDLAGRRVIEKLKPKSFTWKKTGKDGMGFIAQDIEKVLPDLVEADEEGMRAVNYLDIIAPLVDNVQELNARVKELEGKS